MKMKGLKTKFSKVIALVLALAVAAAVVPEGGVTAWAVGASGRCAYQGTNYNVVCFVEDVDSSTTATVCGDNKGGSIEGLLGYSGSQPMDLTIPGQIDTIYGSATDVYTGNWTVTAIPKNCFNNTDDADANITGVLTIPNTITSIGDNAFDGNDFSTIVNNSNVDFTYKPKTDTHVLYDSNGNALTKNSDGSYTIAAGTSVVSDTSHILNTTTNTGLAISLSDSTGTATTEYEYTGSAVTPTVTVTVDGTTLTQGTDYTVEYSNNTAVGTATVTITGIGDYVGTTSITYTIKEKEDTTKSPSSSDDDSIGSLETVVATITAISSEKDAANSTFAPLQATAKKVKATSLTLSWKKVSGASSYVVYGAVCGKAKYAEVATTSGTKAAIKKIGSTKLKKGTYYKFVVVAVNSNSNVVSISKTVHAATSGGKFINVKSISTAKAKATLKVKKTLKLNATSTNASSSLKLKTHRKLSYESSDTSVATVSKKGVVKAVAKGKCTIYVYAQNGVQKAVKITVK